MAKATAKALNQALNPSSTAALAEEAATTPASSTLVDSVVAGPATDAAASVDMSDKAPAGDVSVKADGGVTVSVADSQVRSEPQAQDAVSIANASSQTPAVVEGATASSDAVPVELAKPPKSTRGRAVPPVHAAPIEGEARDEARRASEAEAAALRNMLNRPRKVLRPEPEVAPLSGTLHKPAATTAAVKGAKKEGDRKSVV